MIVTLTINPTVDKSCGIERVEPDRKLRCGEPAFDPGGGGINVARAIFKLGGEAVAWYSCGGPPGQMLFQLLDREGVDHRPLPIEGWTRENMTVYEESSGRQYRFVMPGPTLREGEWREAIDAVAALDPAPQYLVASGSLPSGVPARFYAELVDAMDRRSRIVVDTSGEALRLAIERGVYMVKPNLRELGHLVGRELGSEAEQEEAARSLVKEGRCALVVLSMGQAGAMLVWGEGRMRFRSPTVPIRSRVGAGDSMTAAVVLALSRGFSPPEAVRYGVAAGASAVMTPGTELCRLDETERIYRNLLQEHREA